MTIFISRPGTYITRLGFKLPRCFLIASRAKVNFSASACVIFLGTLNESLTLPLISGHTRAILQDELILISLCQVTYARVPPRYEVQTALIFLKIIFGLPRQ